jgi:bifunctional non-homologous end joining protein LigD
VSRKVVEIAGKRLALSNLEKELYPSCGFTKANVLEYYGRMSGFILPHLKNRALTLKRYPDGVEKKFFFEKRCPTRHPAWVRTAEVSRGSKQMTICLANNPETLIWVENLASLELHVPLAQVDSPERPDAMVFDLDPGEQAGIIDCARVALILKKLLYRLHLTGYPKTSGQKGLHVYVPLNLQEATFEDTKRFSKAVALIMQKNFPYLVTSKMPREQRTGKVFINWSQNDPSKTMICVYSLRGREQPFVSFPLTWHELEAFTRKGNPDRLQIMSTEAVQRVETAGDLFWEVLTKKQR